MTRRLHPTARCALTGAMVLMLCALASTAMAQKGAIYVATHIEPETTRQIKGAQASSVYIYDSTGWKISSGKGAGGWQPGEAIPLEPGEYWISLGTEESRHALHRYTVEAKETTLVESGWVSVASLPLAEQPHVDCAQWTAVLRAYVAGPDGKLELVAANSNARADEYGTIQLHPGQYVIEFNRLKTNVMVEAGKDYRLPTGYAGPAIGGEAYLLAEKGDDPRRQGLTVCTDGALHVLAGDYFMWETVTRDEGATIDHKVSPYTVTAEGNQGYSSLKEDRPADARSRDSDGRAITPDQARSLANWGKKKGEFDDLDMFSDPR